MHSSIVIQMSTIEEICKQYAVKRLILTGSAARDDFDPEKSDVDFIVEFDGLEDLFDRFFQLKSSLESTFSRTVDVIQRGAITNPYLLASLDEDAVAVYEAQP